MQLHIDLDLRQTFEGRRNAFSPLLREGEISVQNWNFYTRSTRELRGRRFHALSRVYFGTFPLAAREGGQICVTLGCRCPLIHSRMHASQVQLLGERYVPRLMNGEVLLRSLLSTW
jgi:hypothetical protein